MKILLIEDHDMFSESIKNSLEKYEEIAEVSILSDIHYLDKHDYIENFDIVLMDINIKKLGFDCDGLSLSKKLIREYKKIKIVILTGFDMIGYEREAKNIGAYGFICKDESTKFLVDKLKKIVENDVKIFDGILENTDDLTNRELEILRLYAGGMTRADVAKRCNIATTTLAYNLNSIYSKLGVRNYQEMVNKALELGYIKPNFF